MNDAVVIALGSNLAGGFESSNALLAAALEAFELAGLSVLRVSSWWRSASWPDPTRPDYLNGVALVGTSLAPVAVLRVLQDIEGAFGRVREAPNAPRTLDLDLIAHGRAVIDAGDLILPHPRAAERLFVMGPLAEIAPGWIHPVLGRSARALAVDASVGADARPLAPTNPDGMPNCDGA
jgi:2-amino-4-hydroxy-6-hydroxymethyldihydropteridine diphosphokinase